MTTRRSKPSSAPDAETVRHGAALFRRHIALMKMTIFLTVFALLIAGPAMALNIDAKQLRIESEYVPPQTKPNVEHLFPVPLVQAIEDWGRKTLVPAGRAGVVWLIIKEARVTETPLNPPVSLFTRHNEFRYDGKIAIEIEIRDGAGKKLAGVRAGVTASRELLQKASKRDRDGLWIEMTQTMISILDREARKALRTHASNLVR